MKNIVLDIEANGLLDTVSKMHCAVATDIDSENFKVFTDGEELIEFLQDVETLVGHSIIQYDIPVLVKLFGFKLPTSINVIDTLILSRLDNPDRVGGHSLEAWSKSFGKFKVQNEDWTELTQNMLDRCISDTSITLDIYKYLINNKHWSDEVEELEHNVAKIISQQEVNGVAFDKKKAETLIIYLDGTIDEIDQEILKMAPPIIKKKGTTVDKPYTLAGKRSARARKYVDDDIDISGAFDPISIEEIRQSSHKQMKDWFLSIGWEPDVWNMKDGERTSPKLEGESLTKLPNGIGQKYSDRVTRAHRRSQVQGWVDRVRPDGRLTAGCNTIGTNTYRFRHSVVVNVPKADDGVFLGKEMRSLFVVPPRYRLVGHDASQLELRLFAAAVNDEEYIQQVLSGDIHTHNQQLAGLNTRNDAKTFIYAFLYGAGDEKIGKLVGGGAAEGKQIKRKFSKELPGYAKLVSNLKKEAKRGYLTGLDGRKVWMRKGSDGRILEHKALNTYIQSAGAIVMKRSMVILNKKIELSGITVSKVLDMHDEAQAQVLIKDADTYGKFAVESIREAGEYYNLACPLDGEYKIGKNWAETH